MSEATAVQRSASRPVRAMRLFRVQVGARFVLSPHMTRITVVGDDLRHFVSAGPDQRIKVLLPREGQLAPAVEDDMTPRGILGMPEDIRPTMRTYTVRRHRPQKHEVDIDFVLHEDGGPASRWAATAAVGDALALWGPVSAYQPAPECRWQLLMGDETAIPAIGAIVESLAPGVRAEVIIQVADAAEEQQWTTAGDVRVRWLHDGSLLDAVSTLDIPTDETRRYAWVAGEQSMATDVRAHLIHERQFDREDVYFSGYWRRGKSENED